MAGLIEPSIRELINDLKLLLEIPERIDELTLIRLKELHGHLNFHEENIQDKIIKSLHVHQYLAKKPKVPDDQLYEYYKIRVSDQHGLTFVDITRLRDLITNRIDKINHRKQVEAIENRIERIQSRKAKEQPKWLSIGVLFASGEIPKLLGEGKNPPKVEEHIKIKNASKYILATVNEYKNSANKSKDIYNSHHKMKTIIEHCKSNDLPITDDFLSRFRKLVVKQSD